MLTRLQVTGFKNLEIDVRFGPFTCIAGPNGVGKSNLFDAISFLAALADRPLVDAAAAVRGGDSHRGGLQRLFRRVGSGAEDRMTFGVEFVVPRYGEDDLGQPAEASMTFLRYDLALVWRPGDPAGGTSPLQVQAERMVHIVQSRARAELGFPHSSQWRSSAVLGRRTTPYISTSVKDGSAVVALHADSASGLGGGRPRQVPAARMPRTMLSTAGNSAEHRTLVLARQEMRSWTHLQLEPSALRRPDDLTAPRSMGADGGHLAATLFALAQRAEAARSNAKGKDGDAPPGKADLYARVANRLSQLVGDVRSIGVDVDEKRQLLSVVLTDMRRTDHLASALSDGTLRFLALAVLEESPSSGSVVCLEEPENGMHPSRIPAVIQLLRDIAVDASLPVADDNPLRQVIVNSHSPSVVACLRDDELLVAESRTGASAGGTLLVLRCLPDTWRSPKGASVRTATRSQLLEYLDPLSLIRTASPASTRRRVVDRADLVPFRDAVAEP